MFLKLYTRLATLKSDRGEGPVPYIIMVSVIALLAVAVAVTLRARATGFLNTVPSTAP